MTHKQKAEKFRELAYEANGIAYPPKSRWIRDQPLPRQRWKDLEELDTYLRLWGGRIKSDGKKRKGCLVAHLQDESIQHSEPIYAEVPMDFAMKVLAMGGFP